jgi:hypothetical protein
VDGITRVSQRPTVSPLLAIGVREAGPRLTSLPAGQGEGGCIGVSDALAVRKAGAVRRLSDFAVGPCAYSREPDGIRTHDRLDHNRRCLAIGLSGNSRRERRPAASSSRLTRRPQGPESPRKRQGLAWGPAATTTPPLPRGCTGAARAAGDGCCWAGAQAGQPSPKRHKPGAELGVQGLWRPSTARPRRVACSGGDQKSGPGFAPRLLSHARIDRPARVICPPPWPVVARARVTPLMVDQPNSIPVPEGA